VTLRPQVRLPAMLLVLIVGNQKVRRSAVAQWYSVHSKSAEIHSVGADVNIDRRAQCGVVRSIPF